ncbi:MAG: DUF2202 domain-containing protein [Epsilonproteobacteria bacterium]|nr:DUF2202 domain-containing protein [Campylobacterota bacterium]
MRKMRRRALMALALGAITTASLDARWGHFGGGHGGGGVAYQQVATTPAATLTQKQKDDLIFMYQEEKLARDVYITLGRKWGARVFLNIQNSEQRHMDAVRYLLNKYNLRVPVLSDDIGVFENEELQALYNQLVAKGSQSLRDALEVGVTIEETDIADLEEKMEGAPADIKSVYSNLLRGSYNHLRAFKRNLEYLR